MPEDRQRVLTYSPRQHPRWRINLQVYEAYGVNALAWWLGESNQIVSEMHITHWQPLPTDLEGEMGDDESRVTIRWTGLVHIDLEKEFVSLLAEYGFECTDRGRDTDGDEERVLVFRQPE